MAGAFPLPLAGREISDWLDSHPPMLPREDMDEVMFALDAVCLAADDE
jgi:hypothetical protein